jgi:hypothetical protein
VLSTHASCFAQRTRPMIAWMSESAAHDVPALFHQSETRSLNRAPRVPVGPIIGQTNQKLRERGEDKHRRLLSVTAPCFIACHILAIEHQDLPMVSGHSHGSHTMRRPDSHA